MYDSVCKQIEENMIFYFYVLPKECYIMWHKKSISPHFSHLFELNLDNLLSIRAGFYFLYSPIL